MSSGGIPSPRLDPRRTAAPPPPPDGFVLQDDGGIPPPPPGFRLVERGAPLPPPKGFVIVTDENRQDIAHRMEALRRRSGGLPPLDAPATPSMATPPDLTVPLAVAPPAQPGLELSTEPQLAIDGNPMVAHPEQAAKAGVIDRTLNSLGQAWERFSTAEGETFGNEPLGLTPGGETESFLQKLHLVATPETSNIGTMVTSPVIRSVAAAWDGVGRAIAAGGAGLGQAAGDLVGALNNAVDQPDFAGDPGQVKDTIQNFGNFLLIESGFGRGLPEIPKGVAKPEVPHGEAVQRFLETNRAVQERAAPQGGPAQRDVRPWEVDPSLRRLEPPGGVAAAPQPAAEAPPVRPAPAQARPAPPRPPPAAAAPQPGPAIVGDDIAILKAAGWSDTAIADMAPDELTAAVEEARAQGVEAPVAAASPAEAPSSQPDAIVTPPPAKPAPVTESPEAAKYRQELIDAGVSGPALDKLVKARREQPPAARGTRIGEPATPAPVPTAEVARATPKEPVQPPTEEAVPTFAPEVVAEARPDADKSVGTFNFNPVDLKTDARRFQFKSETDQEGVNTTLRNVDRWRRERGNQLIVWQDKAGEKFVVDGHQRTGLAKRLLSEGKEQSIQIPGVLFREADGVSTEDVTRIAALKNIAEGSTSPVDAAKVLRLSGPKALADLPMPKEAVRTAVDLSKLSDEPFQMVVNEKVDPNHAKYVGRFLADDPDRQQAAMNALNRADPANEDEAAVLVRRVAASELSKGEAGAQSDMFGTAPDSTAIEEVKIVAGAVRQLRGDKKLFARLVKEADKIEATGSKIARGAAGEAVSDADRLATEIEALAFRAGPIRDSLVSLAREVKDGRRSLGDAREALVDALRVEARGARPDRAEAGRGEAEGGSGQRRPVSEKGKSKPGSETLGSTVAREPTTEPGAEGKPQTVLPGTERISEAEVAKRRQDAEVAARQAREKIAPKKPQKSADEGLFGDGHKQLKLLSALPARALEAWRKHAQMIVDGRPVRDMPVLDKSPILAAAGVRERITLRAAIAKAIRSKHPDIPADVWLDLPNLLADPLFVFSREAGNPNVVLIARTEAGAPVLVGLRAGEITTITPIDPVGDMTSGQRIAANLRAALGRPGVVYARSRAALDRVLQLTGANSRAGRPHGTALPGQGTKARIVTRDNVIKGSGGARHLLIAPDAPAPAVKLDARDRRILEARLRNRVAKLAGLDVKVFTFDTIPTEDAGSAGYKADMEKVGAAGGKLSPTAGGSATMHADGTAIIEFALNDPLFDPDATGYHEPYHIVEGLLMTDAEFAFVSRPENIALARKAAAETLGLDPDSPVIKALPGYEARAIAFERYGMRRDRGDPAALAGSHLPPWLLKIFERLHRLLHAVRKVLGDLGYRRLEDIFEDVYQGKMANRPKTFRSLPEAEKALFGDGAEARVGSVTVGGESYAAIKVYHGSPHDFDQFSVEKIGTGEGAQAYGHGLYFAESPGVAKSYQENLIGVGKQHVARNLAQSFLREHSGDTEAAAAALEKEATKAKSPYIKLAAQEAAQSIRNSRMYEVSIDAHPDEFLDWDKPLSEQSPKVQKILADNWLAHPEAHAHQTGGQIYESSKIVPGDYSSKEMAAENLKAAGIKGIRYKDAGSRSAEGGTHNYVVFDDKIVTITGKDGKPVKAETLGSTIPHSGRARAEEAKPERAGDERAILDRIGEATDVKKAWNWNDLYTDLKDDLNPIRVATKILTDGKALPPENDPYILARLTRGSFGQAEHFIDHGTFAFDTLKDNGKSLKAVLEPVADDLDGFRAYAIAKRAIELSKRDIKTGVPMREALSVSSRGAAKYEKPFRELIAYQRRLTDYMKDSGILSEEQVAAMVEANKDYVPFFRVMDDPALGGASAGPGLRVRNPVRGIRGSGRQIVDPIESIVKNTYLFVSLAERNRALTALADLAESSPRGAEVMEKLKPKFQSIAVTEAEVAKFMEEHGIAGDPEAFTVFRPKAFKPADDQIAVFRNGKRQVYRVPEQLAQAVTGMDRYSAALWIKIMRLPARALRAGVTIVPDFAIRNLVRDQLTAFTYSKNGYLPLWTAMQGLGSLLTKGENYRNWLKGGGANSAMVAIDRRYVDQKLLGLDHKSLGGRAKNVVTKPFEMLRIVSELAENATRIGEFGRAQVRGKGLRGSSFEAREVTLDFQRIGAKTRGLNQVIAFFNPQVEGEDRMVRAFKERPFATLAKVLLGITLPSVLLWWANHDDPRWKEIPKWEKDLFWIVLTKNHIYRIPKPFELGILFGSVPERILDAFVDHDPEAFNGLGSTIAGAGMPSFVPTALLPVAEQYANWSTFFDRPIVPRSQQDILPEYQSTDYTTESAKELGHLIARLPVIGNTTTPSPMVIENYISAWSGNLGRYVLSLADAGLEAVGITPASVDPTPTLADMPFIKSFVVRYPSASAQSIETFYKYYGAENTKAATQKALTKLGRDDEADGLGDAVNLRPYADALSNMRNEISEINRDPDMTPDEKRKQIDQTYLDMIDTAKEGLADFYEQTANPAGASN